LVQKKVAEVLQVWGAGETIQKALDGEARENEVWIDAELLRVGDQTGVDGAGEACRFVGHATSASMYGRITRSTRQIRAK